MKYFFPLFLLALFFLPSTIHASGNWYFPIRQFSERQSDKAFGQYFDKAWYVGKTARFPAQFTGFHAAVDLEIFPDELNQPVAVYAVGDGKIVYAARVTGYGGLILEQLTGTGDTALYGHLKLTNLTVRVGDSVTAGARLTFLGDAFSSQTGGERKHLHFGIYKGSDLYFKGYEQTQSALSSRWENPTDFLKSRSAIDVSAPTATPSQPLIKLESSASALFIDEFPFHSPVKQFIAAFLRFFRNLFGQKL